MSAKAELRDLENERVARQDKVGTAQRACAEAQHRGQRERGALLDYERAQGEGAEPDPELRTRLVKEWDDAREGLEPRTSMLPHGSGIYDLAQQWVDPLLEEQLVGAERKHQAAKDEVRSFIEANIGRLGAEDEAEAEREAAEATEALAAVRAVADRIERKRRWWTGVAAQGDLHYLIPTIPENAVGEMLASAPKVVPPPMPEVLILSGEVPAP